MPRYTYACAACGPFDAARSLAEFADPCDCPSCGALAERQLALPMLAGGAAPLPLAADGGAKTHRAGCGCCSPMRSKIASATTQAAGASKTARAAAPAFLSGG